MGNREVNQRCKHLSAAWEELEDACEKRSSHLNKAVKREQVPASSLQTPAILMCFIIKCGFSVIICDYMQILLDCTELEVCLSETSALVSTDYGKNELATQSLVKQHQVSKNLQQVSNMLSRRYVQCGLCCW